MVPPILTTDNDDNDDTVDNDEAVNDNQQQTQEEVDQEMDRQYGARSGDRKLRPRKPRNYEHLHATLDTLITSQHKIWDTKPKRPREDAHAHTLLTGIALSQHSMKKGIKLFGQAGIDAVQAELNQLHK